MKSKFTFLAQVTAVLAATAHSAFAGAGSQFFAVPEPSSLSLVALGAGAVIVAKFFKKK